MSGNDRAMRNVKVHLAVLAWLTATALVQGAEWCDVSSMDGMFVASFPTEPSLVVETRDARSIKKCARYHCVMPAGNQKYSITWEEIHPEFVDSQVDIMQNREKQVAMLDNVFKKIGLSVKSKRDLPADGFSHMEMTGGGEIDGKRCEIVLRSAIFRDRRYQCIVVADEDQMNAADRDRFFNSIRLGITPSKHSSVWRKATLQAESFSAMYPAEPHILDIGNQVRTMRGLSCSTANGERFSIT